jgi:hypothetical protein
MQCNLKFLKQTFEVVEKLKELPRIDTLIVTLARV